MTSRSTWTSIALSVCLLVGIACTKDKGPAGSYEEIDLSICDPTGGPFTIEIDNPFFPLPVGRELILEGLDDGTLMRVEVKVLNETEEVAGVTTRVVTETEYEDGELIEISRNFFVQAADGTVCYYGEDVDDYKDGAVVSHDGAWRAGSGNRPGIMMPGSPRPETKFYQEYAPGVAKDMSAIQAINQSITVEAGAFTGVVHAIDWNPMEGQTSANAEDKYYAPNIGLVVDDVVELISYIE